MNQPKDLRGKTLSDGDLVGYQSESKMMWWSSIKTITKEFGDIPGYETPKAGYIFTVTLENGMVLKGDSDLCLNLLKLLP